MITPPPASSAWPLPELLRPLPVRELASWAAFGIVLALLLLYFVGAEQGATALVTGHGVHEFVHDGRHLLGFPCH